MTALAQVAGWLRCPVCGRALQLEDRSVRCEARHTFDVARQGYVNLLGRAGPRNADNAEMLAARERFLSAGHYAPVAEAVPTELIRAERVLEVGAGTGHYIARSLAPTAWGVALDVSVPAARRAARAHPRLASIVADTWAGLPLADASVDAVLCVFAPRNVAEFLRVIRPGGKVVVVVPNAGHLAELRDEYGLLHIDDDKADQVEQAFGSAAEINRVTFRADLDEAAATDLVAMGPNAFHGNMEIAATSVTIDVSVLRFCPTLSR